jgi:hypothetical protein
LRQQAHQKIGGREAEVAVGHVERGQGRIEAAGEWHERAANASLVERGRGGFERLDHAGTPSRASTASAIESAFGRNASLRVGL